MKSSLVFIMAALILAASCCMPPDDDEPWIQGALNPDWSPDGTKIVFEAFILGEEHYDIFITDVATRKWTRLTTATTEDSHPKWSPDGTKILFEARVPEQCSYLCVMNADGTNLVNITSDEPGESVVSCIADWSPDGTKIIIADEIEGDWEICTIDPDGNNLINLTNSLGGDAYPAWSEDSTKIIFRSGRTGFTEIYLMDSDGSNQTKVTDVQDTTFDFYNYDLSPDNSKVVYDAFKTSDNGIFTIDSNGMNETRLITSTNKCFDPKWSPDGTKILYASLDTGLDYIDEIKIMDADGQNQQVLTTFYITHNSENYNGNFEWSPDGSRIAFCNARGPVGVGYYNELYIMNPDGSNIIPLTNYD